MCGKAGCGKTVGCGYTFSAGYALLLGSSVASVSAAPVRRPSHMGAGFGSSAATATAAASDSRRALQDFDNSCDLHALGCKTLATCDVAGGYPMTEDRQVFDTICLANTYYAEPAHSGLYDTEEFLTGERQGFYKCSCCGLPLYSSTHAYDAGSGWPAFFDTIDGEAVSDNSQAILHNAANGELVCKRCGMHLGHRFGDGPAPTNLRDCIDSACLSFVEGEPFPAVVAPAPPPVPVYFGAGCYWHTNYDMFLVESEQFGRTDLQITSHVGYGGGPSPGPDGLVCYHNSQGASLYSDYFFAESTEVVLDGDNAEEQFSALLVAYFEEFVDGSTPGTIANNRQDPGDWGPAYRNNIGLPGGMRGDLYPLIVAANERGMTLAEGQGAADTLDEQTVYIYDTDAFPFYRGEQYHQFHANVVLRRPVPDSYTIDLKNTQALSGLINPTGCPDSPIPGTPIETIGWQLCENVLAPENCRYAGSVTRDGASWTIIVSLPAATHGHTPPCAVGDDCGTITYVPLDVTTANTCSGPLTFTSVEGESPSSTIYNFAEQLSGADCISSPSLQIAAASGGVISRSFDGAQASMSALSCEEELNTLLVDRFNTACDSDGMAVNGVPDTCSESCWSLWLPFAASCSSYLSAAHPELNDFTRTCQAAVPCDCVDDNTFAYSCQDLVDTGVLCSHDCAVPSVACWRDLGIVAPDLAGVLLRDRCPLTCSVCSCGDNGH